ncbi:hypothetical protein CBR_g63065 [Chara braunii]|uniref:Uncharacterized protein n=1 Tax=Chara braunii TaxID=69332 RepID=A0A388K8T8_CHABU|nr:hypothetical protein CBR_g63065 [Chara braunii]|eukprot:GBG66482.1 hypothetical protein CBR_g63065 [Chara braunii]
MVRLIMEHARYGVDAAPSKPKAKTIQVDFKFQDKIACPTLTLLIILLIASYIIPAVDSWPYKPYLIPDDQDKRPPVHTFNQDKRMGAHKNNPLSVPMQPAPIPITSKFIQSNVGGLCLQRFVDGVACPTCNSSSLVPITCTGSTDQSWSWTFPHGDPLSNDASKTCIQWVVIDLLRQGIPRAGRKTISLLQKAHHAAQQVGMTPISLGRCFADTDVSDAGLTWQQQQQQQHCQGVVPSHRPLLRGGKTPSAGAEGTNVDNADDPSHCEGHSRGKLNASAPGVNPPDSAVNASVGDSTPNTSPEVEEDCLPQGLDSISGVLYPSAPQIDENRTNSGSGSFLTEMVSTSLLRPSLSLCGPEAASLWIHRLTSDYYKNGGWMQISSSGDPRLCLGVEVKRNDNTANGERWVAKVALVQCDPQNPRSRDLWRYIEPA